MISDDVILAELRLLEAARLNDDVVQALMECGEGEWLREVTEQLLHHIRSSRSIIRAIRKRVKKHQLAGDF